jgi:hypothetical protein
MFRVAVPASTFRLTAALAATLLLPPAPLAAEDSVTLSGVTFVNHGLVGMGRIPASQRDDQGETFGSGSGMAFDTASWKKTRSGYRGDLLLLPDRGHNKKRVTINYRARVNILAISFEPVPVGQNPSPAKAQKSVKATLKGTILLNDAAGAYLTGLDPGAGMRPKTGKFPALPRAATGHVSIDPEAIVRMPDGVLYISDEYGPYIYRFSPAGKMLGVLPPLGAFTPVRSGVINFSSLDPDPDSGRINNRGFEGLALTPQGRFLVALLQSATRQDGGKSSPYTRAVFYDAADPARPKPAYQYVVPLPTFQDESGRSRVAAPSELTALSDTLFLMLCRDGDNGFGTNNPMSRYRRIELLDFDGAKKITGSEYEGTKPLTPGGTLDPSIAPGKLVSFIDLNDAEELKRFGLHNREPNDRNNLSEKWESIGLVSVLDPAHPDDFFLFVGNDNDFITQRGFQAGAKYQDESGVEVDTMFLVYRVTLPGFAARLGKPHGGLR